jgi:hypothetical protein
MTALAQTTELRKVFSQIEFSSKRRLDRFGHPRLFAATGFMPDYPIHELHIAVNNPNNLF